MKEKSGTPSPRSTERGRGEAAGVGVGRGGPEVPWAEKVGMRSPARNGPSPADLRSAASPAARARRCGRYRGRGKRAAFMEPKTKQLLTRRPSVGGLAWARRCGRCRGRKAGVLVSERESRSRSANEDLGGDEPLRGRGGGMHGRPLAGRLMPMLLSRVRTGHARPGQEDRAD